MNILYGEQLATELRKLGDKISNRLWIAVPYIGGIGPIKKILGKQWYDNTLIDVRLVTDTSDLTCIDLDTLTYFNMRGEIRSLKGLHAKIYILDNNCLITSANLTETAFSKRHEVGILFSIDSNRVIEIFEKLWSQSEKVILDKLDKVPSGGINRKEEYGPPLEKIFELPTDPGAFLEHFVEETVFEKTLTEEPTQKLRQNSVKMNLSLKERCEWLMMPENAEILKKLIIKSNEKVFSKGKDIVYKVNYLPPNSKRSGRYADGKVWGPFDGELIEIFYSHREYGISVNRIWAYNHSQLGAQTNFNELYHSLK